MSTIQLLDYNQLTWAQQHKFRMFCEAAADTGEPAAANMRDLPTLVHQRFQRRHLMMVVMDNERIVGCSGCYVSDFSQHIGLLGVRSWLNHSHRSLQIMRDDVLPKQRAWMMERGMKQVAVTFNTYNRGLAELFKRSFVKRVPRSPQHLFYLNLHQVPFDVLIQHTPQLVLYELLDPTWEFDWSTLAA